MKKIMPRNTRIQRPAQLCWLSSIAVVLMLCVWIPASSAQAPGGDFEGPPPGFDRPPMDEMDGERPMRRWFKNRQNQQQPQQQRQRGGKKGPNRLARISKFLEFANNYHHSIRDPHDAFGLAVMGIVEHYKRARQPEKAVAELEQLLSKTTDPEARNMVLFSLRQLFQEARNQEEVLRITHQIAQENLRIIESKKK